MQDPTPILCTACGGPAVSTGDVSVQCPYCDTRDVLPREGHARARELQRRLAERARAVARMSGVAAALAFTFETSRRLQLLVVALSVGIAFGLLDIVARTYDVATRLDAAVPGRAGTIATVATSGLGSLAFFAAILFGLLVARRSYRRDILPDLQALPPRQHGGDARCRCCAAALPHEPGPLLRCRHCRTYSLVTPALFKRVRASIAQDMAAHRRQLTDAATRTAAMGRRLNLLCFKAFAGMFTTTHALSWLIQMFLR
jgi:hypothetical protein